MKMTKTKKKIFKVATVVGSLVVAFMCFISFRENTKIVNADENESTANVTLPYTIQTTNWATAPNYGATAKITVNPVEEVLKDGNKLYGYKLSSDTPYSSTVTSGNTTTPLKNAVTGEEVVVNGYSMPYCQDLTFSIDQAINTKEDVEFLMSPIVKGGKGVDYSTRFVMALSDKAGTVHGLTTKSKNGFNTDGNFYAWEFANDRYADYDNRQQMNGPKVYETNSVMKAQVEASGTTVGQYTVNGTTTDYSTTEMADSWVSNAFYGLSEYRNSTANDSVTYNGSEIFVRVRISFTETTFTITFEHVYKDAIKRECSYPTHETNCKFTRTYDISDIDFGSDLKLYFGYYNSNVRFTESQLGEVGVKKHIIPMSLGIYNYKNGAIRDLAVSAEDKVLFLNAGDEFSLANIDFDVTYFDGMESDDALTVNFESEDESRVVIEDGKIKVLPNAGAGYANIRVNEQSGRSDTISIMILSGGKAVDLVATDKGFISFGNKQPISKGDEFILSYTVGRSLTYEGQAGDSAYLSVVSLDSYSQLDLSSVSTRNDILIDVNGEKKPLQECGSTQLPNEFFEEGKSFNFVFLPSGNDMYSWSAISDGKKIAEGTNLPYNKGIFAISIMGAEFRLSLNNVIAISGTSWEDREVGVYADNTFGTESGSDGKVIENTAVVYSSDAPETDLTLVIGDRTLALGQRHISDQALKIFAGITGASIYKINNKIYDSVDSLSIGDELSVEVVCFDVLNSIGASVSMLPDNFSLRFSAVASGIKEWMSYGILIAKEEDVASINTFTHEYLTANSISFEDASAEDCEIIEEIQSAYKFAYAKTIEESKLAERYTARAYVKIQVEGGKTVYYYSDWDTEKQTRSAYEVATTILETNHGFKGTAKSSLETYLNKVLDIDSQGNLRSERPYDISFENIEDGKTEITIEPAFGFDFDVSGVSCLIWNGKTIEDADWSKIEEGKIVFDMSLFGGATLWMNGQTELKGPFMDFVWQTRDGTMVVIDGGTPDGSLENYILKNAKGDSIKNGRPYIEAIFISHAHSDHIDGLIDLINNYETNKIEIGNIYMNLPSWEWMDAVEGTSIHRINLKQALEDAKSRGINVVMNLPVGSEIQIDELKFKILFVVDESITKNGINNASMVVKVITPKMSVLFLGDLGVEAGHALLNSKYGSEVKSDIVQMAHHGQSGVDKVFYEAVQATIALWNCPDYVWSVYPSHYWLTTLETRAWMEELGCKVNYVAKDGEIVLR